MNKKVVNLIQNKRAVSDVVATVLIIVITVAAVGILWTAVIPLVKDNLTLTDSCSKADVKITQTQGYTCYDPNKKALIVQVEKGSEEINISKLKFLIYSEGNSESIIQHTDLPLNSRKVFYFFPDYTPSKVSIAPIITTDKFTKECGITSTIDIQNCDLTSIDLNNGLTSYWRFEDTVLDSLGNNNGVFNGGTPIYITGRNGIGKAIDLDGVNDNVQISPASPSGLWTNNTFTISMWFKWKSIQNLGSQYILVWRNDEQPSIKIANSTKLLQLQGTSSITTSLVPVINNWYHIVMVYNGTHATAYLNGTQLSNPIAMNFNPYNNLTRLGVDDAPSGRNFNGTIDEVMFFSYPLNSTQVQDLYNSQK